jgi:glycosyltransferase A (GT-A) superfamily protein (DUF2064 family)
VTADREAQVVVLAKAPVPGRAKTRLTPPYSPVEAADLARSALCDTMAAVTGAAVRRRVLALDGESDGLPTEGWDVSPQVPGGLDERHAAARCRAYADLPLPVLLVGMDTPQVTTRDLDDAVAGLLRAGTDAVLGPAADGGYWAIGLRAPRPEHVVGVPMSRADTGALQLAVLTGAGLGVRHLPELRDVDDAADAWAVARAAPGSRFAATLLRIREGAA